MIKKQYSNRRFAEKGNVFFTLFAAVGVVGAIGIGSMTLLKGPVQTMVRSNQQTVIDNKSELNMRVMINDIIQSTPDCDGDGTIEAAQWQTPLAGEPIPAGGGLFPDVYGTNITDPWGNRFGYCVWDHGTIITDGVTDNGCGPTPNFLEGYSGTAEPFITVISSGPNKEFETICQDFSVADIDGDGDLDTPLIMRAANSDDLINTYTYADARNTMGDNWVFESNDPANDDAAKTTQNLEFSQNVTFNGLLDMSRLGGGLTLPDIAAGITCGASNEGDLFRDSASTPPAIVMCQSGAFVAVAGDSAGSGDIVIPDPNFDWKLANCLVNNNGPAVYEKIFAEGAFANDVWIEGNYIFVASGSLGLRIYNAKTHELILTRTVANNVLSVWSDGNFIHITVENSGLIAFTFDGTALTQVATLNLPGYGTQAVHGDGTYIYVNEEGGGGLTALSFNGTAYTSLAVLGTGVRDIQTANGYIFTFRNDGTNNFVDAYSFDGTNFSLAGTRSFGGTGIQQIFVTDDHVFVANRWGGIDALTFDGTTFTVVAFAGGPPDGAYGIFYDGAKLFRGDHVNGLDFLNFDGASFTQTETISENSRELFGDGRFIYAKNNSGGIKVFSGYECTRANTKIKRTFEDGVGIDYNYRAYTWGRELSGRLGDGGGGVDTNQEAPVAVINHNEFKQMNTSNYVSCGLKTDGSAWCWGNDDEGGLGNGDSITTSQDSPSPVSGNHKFKKIIGHWRGGCGLKDNGTLWCWGADSVGQIGNGATTTNARPDPTQVTISDVVDFDLHDSNRVAVKNDGSLWWWGSGARQGMANLDTPVKIATNIKFNQISVGRSATCGLSRTGEAWCWGTNTDGDIGNGTVGIPYTTPQKVIGISDFIQVSTGDGSSCGVRKNGEGWCWGSDGNGQLGNGENSYTQGVPSKVIDINDFTKISVQDSGSACGITSSGLGYCWGDDSNGALGNGAALTTNQNAPSLIEGLTNIVDISCGRIGCSAVVKIERDAIDSGTTAPVQIYQSNTSGNTVASHGLAVTLDSATINHEAGIGLRENFPTDVTAADTIGAFIGARKSSSTSEASSLIFRTNDGTTQPEIYLTKDGNLAVNASNTNFSGARLGIGQSSDWLAKQYYDGLLVRNNPGPIPSLAYYGLNSLTGNATILSGKELLIQHTDVEGIVVNTVADFSSSATPIFYGDMNIFGNGKSAAIEGYSNTATARAAFEFLRYRGTSAAPSAVTTGDELGEVIFNAHDGTSYDPEGYASIKANVTGAVSAGNVPTDLFITHPDGSASGADYLQITNTGKVNIGAVSNTTGQINAAGRGAADNAVKPGLDLSCNSVNSEGTIRIYENEYQYCDGFQWISLGDPKSCVDDAKFINAYVSNNNTCATFTNGKYACWGSNDLGQIGNGTSGVSILKPQPLASFKSVQTVAAERNSFGLSQDGSIYAWGENSSGGKFGNGLTTNSATPVRAVSNHKYIAVDAGYNFACGLRETGFVDCWGTNPQGQLGNGNYKNSKTPVKVKNLGNVVDIDLNDNSACAVKADGTLWCWGQNHVGQLGIGYESTGENIPRQVAITDVVKVSLGGYRANDTETASCALKSDNTVWCWGNNQFGQVGNGTSGAPNVLNPVQVSGITNAIDISAISRSAFALLDDGRIKGWGNNSNYRLGTGSVASIVSTPVFVSTINNAVKLADGSGSTHMCAITDTGGMQCWGTNGSGITTTTATTPVDVINPLSCNSNKIVFQTSTNYRGNLGGVSGANAICQKHADQANLPGRYLAFIADSLGNSPYKNFSRLSSSYDYILTNGSKITDGWNDLLDDIEGIFNRDEYGIQHSKFAWTGARTNGTAHPNNCNNWTDSTASYTGAVGHAFSTGNWSAISVQACSFLHPLICFQQ
ncbi:MAG: DUF1554 domain-containing protein [Alphaproteobacteria bacterium]|nr:DUF1554 domain-containing protein [Alphaproteobacteria bacterium]NCQ88452.1 DUF1554 domain-containing protein [Alphaproteobacteria bacterium]NCT05995.1 DUF1554 domain-containing protein [Alphaproteobacteria bacterium]